MLLLGVLLFDRGELLCGGGAELLRFGGLLGMSRGLALAEDGGIEACRLRLRNGGWMGWRRRVGGIGDNVRVRGSWSGRTARRTG